eukprot:Gb_13555 [translate_table: standard]
MPSVVANAQPAMAPGIVPLANAAQQPYVSELLSFTLDRLHKEPELLRVDAERLRRQMQEVAVGHYRAFITAADALQSVREEVSSVDKHLESLILDSGHNFPKSPEKSKAHRKQLSDITCLNPCSLSACWFWCYGPWDGKCTDSYPPLILRDFQSI